MINPIAQIYRARKQTYLKQCINIRPSEDNQTEARLVYVVSILVISLIHTLTIYPFTVLINIEISFAS